MLDNELVPFLIGILTACFLGLVFWLLVLFSQPSVHCFATETPVECQARVGDVYEVIEDPTTHQFWAEQK